MKIEVTYFFPRVLGLDKITYAHKDLIIAVCKSTPAHDMDTDRILCYGKKEVSSIDECKAKFINSIKNHWYKEDADNITDITFVDDCDYSLPNKDYFKN